MSDEALYREATLAELFPGPKANPVYSVKYVVPVEPVGYINVRESGFISREQDIEPGRYILVPNKGDNE